MRMYLDVPFNEKDDAKSLGAHWDTGFRSWYVNADQPLQCFVRWIPADASVPGPTVTLPVVLLPTTCWRCADGITCVVGLRVPEGSGWEPSGSVEDLCYVALEDCAPVVGPLLGATLCTRLCIGPLLIRRTRPRPHGYLANTCAHCGATQGAFRLYEDLMTLAAEDCESVDLLWTHGVVVDYPEVLLPRSDAALADRRSSSPRS